MKFNSGDIVIFEDGYGGVEDKVGTICKVIRCYVEDGEEYVYTKMYDATGAGGWYAWRFRLATDADIVLARLTGKGIYL